jgi:hypothetical protein
MEMELTSETSRIFGLFRGNVFTVLPKKGKLDECIVIAIISSTPGGEILDYISKF